MGSNPTPKNWNLEVTGVPCGIYLGPNPEMMASYGIQESHGPDGRRATVYFICFWDQRLDLIEGLLGTVIYQGGTVVRNDPLAYPIPELDRWSPQNPTGIFEDRLFCTAVPSIQGIGPWTDEEGEVSGLDDWLSYSYAVVQAEFTSPPYLIEPLDGNDGPPSDPSFNDLTYAEYTISRVRVSGEVFSPPTGSYIFTGGAFANQGLLDVGASQVRTRFEVSITRVRMPLVPMVTASPLIGTVNQAQFRVAGQLFPMGAVLFTGINPEQHSDIVNGGIVWDVEYTFMANGPPANGQQNTSLDWNYFLDPGGNWSPVQDQNGNNVFAYQDFSPLFSNTIS